MTLRRRNGARALAALLLLAASACTDLKRWAYEGGDRDEWQQPERVVAALAIAPGSEVADLGAGGGYFSFRFAEAVGSEGRVYAIDVDEGLLDWLAEEAQRRGLRQIEVIRAEPDDPRLPESGVDLLFTCNTYHHLPERVDYFRRLRPRLRAGARVAVIEYSGAGLFERLFGHQTSAEQIRDEMQQAGYRLATRHDFLARQHFLVFEPSQAVR